MSISDVDAQQQSSATANELEASGEGGAGRPLRVDAWRRFRKNKLAMIGLIMIVLLVLMAIFAPWVAPHNATDQFRPTREGPTLSHPLGTDMIGRDVLSRVILGARVSLRIAFVATGISVVIGLLVGMVSAYFGGWVDSVLMRLIDIVYAIPYIILAVSLAAVVGRTEMGITLILGFTGWISIARIVRASFLSLKGLEYVEAARALGYSGRRIVLRHMLPNALQPILVFTTIAIGTVILAAAALGFLGVGVQEPTPEWGLMVAGGRGGGVLTNAPHILLFPGGAIVVTVLSFVFVGDGLRDALDPKLK